MTKITKAMRELLLRARHPDGVSDIRGAEWSTARALARRGFVSLPPVVGGWLRLRITPAGLAALNATDTAPPGRGDGPAPHSEDV